MKVLFVCTGNTCRSPFAEGLARKLAGEPGLGAEFASAGRAAAEGQPCPRDAVDTAAAFGVDLAKHRSQRLTTELEKGFDLVHDLGHVADPIGGGPDRYHAAYAEIAAEVEALLPRLSGSEPQTPRS